MCQLKEDKNKLSLHISPDRTGFRASRASASLSLDCFQPNIYVNLPMKVRISTHPASYKVLLVDGMMKNFRCTSTLIGQSSEPLAPPTLLSFGLARSRKVSKYFTFIRTWRKIRCTSSSRSAAVTTSLVWFLLSLQWL